MVLNRLTGYVLVSFTAIAHLSLICVIGMRFMFCVHVF